MKKTYPPLEEYFTILQQKSKDMALSIEEISFILSGKWQYLIILIFSLPFCLPIQIPGVSTPFGITITFLGLEMVFGKYISLPNWILTKKISSRVLQKLTSQALWLAKKMKGLTHPRLSGLCHFKASIIINGFLIAILGLLLALPLPIPFSNLMASWPIFAISLGLLEEDGLFVLIGYLISLFTFAFFVATYFLITLIF